ncbi:PhzF family phenazine biosynthesis protein [Methylosinus sporium]|uniref:PhzF family phenazine biosynthesis protein n=1 Tax=Methylosinus sporium TaxID=428 RepID=UPI001FCE7C80|nr:PhzF family phenazine biosynthesis protein [Methylosinus sporium]
MTVDVFTDRRFGGNPLAVVLDAAGLSTREMQAIAAEFNLAETTFVLPPRSADHTAQIRIFTPRAEMPFAGHPNVGTAFALARERLAAGAAFPAAMRFEEIAGLVEIDLLETGGRPVGARLRSPQPLTVGDAVAVGVLADACSIRSVDIATTRHAPLIAGCGAPFLFAELANLEALAAARPRESAFAEHLPRERAAGVYLYVRTPGGETDIRSRMFAPLHGIIEDPATGSAAVALAALSAELGKESDVRLSMRIGQAFEMGRRSLLDVVAVKAQGRVIETFVGGSCVPVMSGIIELAAS